MRRLRQPLPGPRTGAERSQVRVSQAEWTNVYWSHPLAPLLINFNYVDTGITTEGADDEDLGTLIQAINMSRQALG